jgi:hypothetical protein
MFSNLVVELFRLEIAVAINHLIQECGSSHVKISIQRGYHGRRGRWVKTGQCASRMTR